MYAAARSGSTRTYCARSAIWAQAERSSVSRSATVAKHDGPACSGGAGDDRRGRVPPGPGEPGRRPLPPLPLKSTHGRHRHRARNPPRRPQRPPARGGHLRRGAAADPRRRRVGQDPGADPPDRVPGRDRRGQAERDPRDHVHEQGGGGDARPRRAAGRPPGAGDVGDDVPRRVRADAACPRRQARVHAPVHDLRPGGLAAADQALSRRARDRPQAVHAGVDPQPDLRRQEQAARRGRVRADGRLVLRADRRRRLPRLRARAAPDERDGLRRPARPRGQRARAVPGGPRSATPARSATCSSTSTRTPTTPSTAGSSCSPRSAGT